MRWLAVACFIACGGPGPAPITDPTNISITPPAPADAAIAMVPDAAVASPAPVSSQLPYGPLSTIQRGEQSASNDRPIAARRNDARNLSKREINEDLAMLSRVIDLYFVPRTAEEQAGIQIRDRTAATLHQLAPYSVSSTFNAIMSSSERIGFCARAPDEKWPCDPDFATRPPADPTLPPYEVGVLPSKIGRLVIRDLSNAANPAWAKLDLTPLSKASGLVIDLRAAWGADPRPLLPWLGTITGRATLAPLREIRRSPKLTPYVDAYRARFVAEGRDPDAWAPLVGTSSTGRATIPIVVLIGRHCESACELVTRVLETYADATVIGSVMRSGRLHRDEPAMVTLPHSRIDIYFHATEYLLSTEIEAKTGPTGEWWLARRDEGVDYDGNALAIRELQRRIANRNWPGSCGAFRPYSSPAALPQALRKKIPNAFHLDDKTCEGSHRSISIKADITLHTMRRFVASCQKPAHIGWRSEGNFGFGVVVGVELVSQLAQSDVVESVNVGCHHPPQPN